MINDDIVENVLQDGKEGVKQNIMEALDEFCDEYADEMYRAVEEIIGLRAENAALRERLEKAVELPRTEVSPYDSNDTLLYYIAAGHIQQECFNNKFPEQLQTRLAELKGEKK